jgi:hypothetical protein
VPSQWLLPPCAAQEGHFGEVRHWAGPRETHRKVPALWRGQAQEGNWGLTRLFPSSERPSVTFWGWNQSSSSMPQPVGLKLEPGPPLRAVNRVPPTLMPVLRFRGLGWGQRSHFYFSKFFNEFLTVIHIYGVQGDILIHVCLDNLHF